MTQPELGAPWFQAAGAPVYVPPAFFWWWYGFDAYAPRVFNEGAVIAASGGLASIAVAIGMSVLRAREAKDAATYGSARWADDAEVGKAKLTGDRGVVLGRLGERYLRHDGPEDVLIAPLQGGEVYRWDTRLEHAVEFACLVAGRDVTEAEWTD